MDEPLANWVAQVLGSELRHCRPVGGGCIHSAWALELADGRRLFAKTNAAQALPLLEAEAEGLQALRAVAVAGLVIPEPLHCGLAGDRALLLLEWLELEHRPGKRAWAAAGGALARLHRRSAAGDPGAFGWARDNFIGSGPQPNGWCEDWGRFFAERRLGSQLCLAAAGGRPLRGASALLECTPDWLNAHGAIPCLVHGDLWSGNAGVLTAAAGSPDPGAAGPAALFDPAVHRGDREVDLAMAHLFGGFPPAFFAGYQQHWPLPAGHERRRDLYNLYHLINHANLFGGSYFARCQAGIDKLLAGSPRL